MMKTCDVFLCMAGAVRDVCQSPHSHHGGHLRPRVHGLDCSEHWMGGHVTGEVCGRCPGHRLSGVCGERLCSPSASQASPSGSLHPETQAGLPARLTAWFLFRARPHRPQSLFRKHSRAGMHGCSASASASPPQVLRT